MTFQLSWQESINPMQFNGLVYFEALLRHGRGHQFESGRAYHVKFQYSLNVVVTIDET